MLFWMFWKYNLDNVLEWDQHDIIAYQSFLYFVPSELVFFKCPPCSPHRTLVSVTRHTCWCSACFAVWVSCCVWPHQWPWSGQACGWPKNCTTICWIILFLPQWGTSETFIFLKCLCGITLCIIWHASRCVWVCIKWGHKVGQCV